MDVSDSGIAVGWRNGTDGSRGYTWTPTNGLQPIVVGASTQFPIYTAVNDPSQPLRINSSGVVVGQGYAASGLEQGATWALGQGLTFVGSFDGNAQGSRVTSINDLNEVGGSSAGGSYNGAGPMMWTAATGVQALAGFNGLNGEVFGINASKQIAGAAAGILPGRTVAFTWSPTSGQTVIPDASAGVLLSQALAINDSGVVVGRYVLPDSVTYRTFRWSAATGTVDLNAPTGYPETMDINNAGDIVVTIDGSFGRVPYLYNNGTWTNLNQLMPPGVGFTLQFVEAINNRGWIAGSGTTDVSGVELGQGFVIVPPNHPPTAVDGSISTAEDTSLNGILSATDPDGDAVTYTIVANAGKGLATITDAASGAFTYTPNANAIGSDSFTFKASDGRLGSNTATVAVTITAVNDAPVAFNGTASAMAGTSVTGTLVATDVDNVGLSYAIVTNGTRGTANVTNASTGAFSYTANAGTTGTDTFTFKANDGSLDSNVATVTLTISPATGACAANITTSVAVTQTAPKLNRKTGRYSQTITLKNADGATPGPVSLVFDSLSANATLFQPTGTTTCSVPLGSSYVNVDVGVDSTFRSRERATVTVEFNNSSGQPIGYTPRVLAGPGRP